MEKYVDRNKFTKQEKESENTTKGSCLQAQIKSLNRIDLKEHCCHITKIKQVETSKCGNYFAIFCREKQTVIIFKYPEFQLIGDVSVKQYNYNSLEKNRKIEMKFSITNQFLIIKNVRTFFTVDLKQLQAHRLNLPDDRKYQIQGTDQKNQLFLTFKGYHKNIIVCQLQTGIISRNLYFLNCQHYFDIVASSILNTVYYKENFRNKLIGIGTGKMLTLRSEFIQTFGIFSFSKGNSLMITNQINGKLIKKIRKQNCYIYELLNIYIAQNDLIIQVSGERFKYEIHCFKFQFHKYYPKNEMKLINETLGVKLVKKDVIEFIHYV